MIQPHSKNKEENYFIITPDSKTNLTLIQHKGSGGALPVTVEASTIHMSMNVF